MALYINGQLQTMSSKIRYNESTDMVQIYYQGQWHDWQAGGANIPDGSTVTPINDVTIWQKCAGISNPTHTTLSDVLADSGVLSILIASDNAIDYMVRSTSFASSVCENQKAMQYIGANNYASDTLIADIDWLTAIFASTYKTSVLNVSIPIMTSNTQPSGVATSSGGTEHQGNAWRAFDNDNRTLWYSTYNPPLPQWIGYQFSYLSKICAISIITRTDSDYSSVNNCILKGSNDGSTWTDINTNLSLIKSGSLSYTLFSNDKQYSRYRVYIPATNHQSESGPQVMVGRIQMFGRKDI